MCRRKSGPSTGNSAQSSHTEVSIWFFWVGKDPSLQGFKEVCFPGHQHTKEAMLREHVNPSPFAQPSACRALYSNFIVTACLEDYLHLPLSCYHMFYLLRACQLRRTSVCSLWMKVYTYIPISAYFGLLNDLGVIGPWFSLCIHVFWYLTLLKDCANFFIKVWIQVF